MENNEKKFLTLEEIKNHLGIDYDDDSSRKKLEFYSSVAEKHLSGMFNNLKYDDERAKMIALCVIEKLYDRDISSKENATIEKLINSFIFQLQWEGQDNSNL